MYDAGSTAYTSGRYSSGRGAGEIVLSNLRCTGFEPRLVDCTSHQGRMCTHSEDAGLRCLAKTGVVYNVCRCTM